MTRRGSSNLAAILTDTAAQHGDRVAFKLHETAVTYSALDVASARVAGLLNARGVGPGDRVAMMVPNVPWFPAIYYGILRAGAVVVPLNVLLKSREVRYHLTDSGASLLFAWGDFAEGAEGAREAGAEWVAVTPVEFKELLGSMEAATELVEREPTDTAVILYTSGTTGQPKGAELTHANLRRNCEAAATIFDDLSPEDTLLGALPLFHSFGQTCTMNAAVRFGSMVTMLPRFDPERALEILGRDEVTIFQGVPTMYNALLHSPGREGADTGALRLCVSGGSAMPVELLRAFEQEFGVAILEGYGLSETSPVASFNHPDRERKPGSIGTPIEGVEMQVWDDAGNEVPQGEVGEIVIRGHNIMKGYWHRDDANKEAITEEGWFRTGDMATMDEDGYFFIVDRKKDLIIRGGYNVYPREIEEVLYEHPAIQEAAVVGVPHDELGEEVGAAVVLKHGESLDAHELTSYVRERVAAYKYPRMVWSVDELPKGATGKILKREIQGPPSARARKTS